jgi:hypothetical protein
MKRNANVVGKDMELIFETWPIDRCVDYARNPRKNDHAVDKVAAAIREFGFRVPIVAKSDGLVVDGHLRLKAAKKLGLTEVPVILADDMSEAQIKAFRLSVNKVAELAEWDDALLGLEIMDLKEMGFDLDLIGFDASEIDALFPVEETAGLTDEDAVPEAPAVPVTVEGDVWLLGRHRLVCGSCTVQTDVDAALQGRKADLCLTDPPYGLGDKKASGKNDYALYEDTLENLIALAAEWLPIARANANAVVFSPGVTRQWIYPEPNWVICWFYGGGQLRSSWGFNCWQPFLCYGKDPSLASGRGARPDAVDMNVPSNSADIDHPCPKPVKLWEWFLSRLVFSPNAVLYEPFNGSGTTLIAAQSKGLAVAAIELDPRYVDVAVKRWQDFTGQQATLEATGQTYDELKAEREAA